MQTIPQVYRDSPIDALTPHPENPRQGDVGAIHTSIERTGFYGAIIVQKTTGFVLAGNHRLAAAAAAGATTVPIIEVDVDDATATRILLADNRTNDLASYDNAALADLLGSIAAEDGVGALVGTGFDADDLDDLLASMQEDEPLPNADGNVSRDPTIRDQLEKYQESATRAVMLEYPLEEFRWIVDALGALRDRHALDSNAEVVMMLVRDANG